MLRTREKSGHSKECVVMTATDSPGIRKRLLFPSTYCVYCDVQYKAIEVLQMSTSSKSSSLMVQADKTPRESCLEFGDFGAEDYLRSSVVSWVSSDNSVRYRWYPYARSRLRPVRSTRIPASVRAEMALVAVGLVV